jgi:cysteine desulfurase family protein (TIGR01976 family)
VDLSIAPFDVDAVRARFPALARPGPDGRPMVWADAPGGSQVPDAVIAAVAGRMRAGASNTHGAFATSREIDALIDDAHAAGADLLGCDADEVVFGQNATSVLLHLSRSFARTLAPGDEVVVTRLDHDANIRPWMLAARDAGATVRWADVREDDVTLDLGSLADAIGPRTKLVACTLASNAVGSMPDVAEVVRLARAQGALVALDGVHFAQHHAPDLRGTGADILATSPYKFFGPHLGMVGVRRSVLETWTPYKLDAAEDVLPFRWETGTQSHEAFAGAIAAIGYIAEAGPAGDRRARVVAGYERFAAHERALTTRFLDGVARIAGIRLFGIGDAARAGERTPTFAIRVGDAHPVDSATALAERGISVWDGHYYAIEVFRRLGLLDTGGAVRIGFCHYHSVDEVDRVLEALADLARPGARPGGPAHAGR